MWSRKFKKELSELLGEPHIVRKIGKWEVKHWKVAGLSIVQHDRNVIRVTDLSTGRWLWDEEEILRRVKEYV